MIDIIQNNPYRQLGVYSNSPTKERVANKGKISAFLKVGKPISFPLDLPDLLSPIERDVNSVSDAESNLTLPVDQIRYAMFWWMKSTPLDDVAFNHLFEGNIDMALSIWEKKNSVSSLQNRIVLALIQGKIESAIECAESLYTQYANEFTKNIVGDSLTLDTPLWQMFFDMLLESGINAQTIANSITISEWKEYISQKTVAPLIDGITKAIATAKTSKGKGSSARLQAGQKLMAETKSLLSQLKQLLSTTDIRYQTIADKLATEILQCGIDYYNDSEDDDCAIKAMKLQKYASTIAVGKMTKDRCLDNIKTLEQVSEQNAIRWRIEAIMSGLERIENANSLEPIKDFLRVSREHLQEIKKVLGSNDDFYIKVSNAVANKALGAVIEYVNNLQGVAAYNKSALKTSLENAAGVVQYIDRNIDKTKIEELRLVQNMRTLTNMIFDVTLASALEEQQRKRQQQQSSGCYIATMVYGDYDHPQVMVLREFRDNYLAHRAWGRQFIKEYYKYSPRLVEKLKDCKWINNAIRKVLDKFVEQLKNKL